MTILVIRVGARILTNRFSHDKIRKVKTEVKIIYLMSITQGMVTQSPEPKPHGKCV